jgi:hypothetical protein
LERHAKHHTNTQQKHFKVIPQISHKDRTCYLPHHYLFSNTVELPKL